MAKARKSKNGPRSGPSARSNRKLEALKRAQKIDEILLMGNVQSQAASDSAVEERPAGESHIVDLLENRKISNKGIFDKAPQARKKPAKAKGQRRAKEHKKANKARKSKKSRKR